MSKKIPTETPPRCGTPSHPYTISQLNRESRALLEGSFALLWVEGEISNLARPRSGHLYFTLKDEFAQARCAMFRMRAQLLKLSPRDGLQVRVRVRVSLYEPRGDYQLIVEQMEEAGVGTLQQRFEMIKAKLSEEGLFEESRKSAIPVPPRRLGVVTSPSGAAIHDILTVLKRRYPTLAVVIYPTQVQGEGAAAEIATTIELANRRDECDLLIVGRGGGSLEDLWAFNEERVARAIAASTIPIISAVGHEVDTTISDYVADARAATPSAAAELLSPDTRVWREGLALLRRRLARATERELSLHAARLQRLASRLQRPDRRLLQRAQRLDELELRLSRATRGRIGAARSRIATLSARLETHNPRHRLARLALQFTHLQQRLQERFTIRLRERREHLGALAHQLNSVSPLATLGRGYSILLDRDQCVVRRSREVEPGDLVSARLAEGSLLCRIEERYDEN